MGTEMSGWAKVSGKDAEAGAWCTIDHLGNDVAEGVGLKSFVENLPEDKILFGAIRIVGVDDGAENVVSSRPKICRVDWQGSKVPLMQRSKSIEGKAKADDVFNGAALTLQP